MDEEQEPTGRRSKVIRRILLGSAATVVLVALRRPLPQLLLRRPQVLVPAGGDEPPGPLTPRWGRVPVVLNRVTDPSVLEAAWAARVLKLQNPEVQSVQPSGSVPGPDAERPESWWTFQVRSRAG